MAEGRMKRRGSGAKSSTSLFGGKKSAELEEFSKKAKEINEARATARKAKATKRKAKMGEIVADLEERKSATSKTSRPSRRRSGQKPQESIKINIGKPTARGTVKKRSSAKTTPAKKAAPAKPKVQKKAPGADAVAGLGAANIALNKKLEKAKPKRKSVVKRILLGKDAKFGGDRGLIDFLPGKSRPKRKKKATGSPASGANRRPKPAGKAMGGMMKSKMASKGGARGGMKNGGLAMTMVDGRKVPAFAADGKGANDLAKKKNGGMMKSKMASKGGAKGGRMPGGMKNGGMAKKGYAKGGAVSRKPRGVGAALRGYGKALK